MTFCVAIRVRDGIIALGDTQIVRGSERHSKGKLAILSHQDHSLFVMSSGLRSVRDKVVIYVEETLRARERPYRRLYEIANLFGSTLRQVRAEDGQALSEAGLRFNSHLVIGGLLADDTEPALFYIYPEGNWIESSEDAPYFVIGRTPYAKPILDRLLSFETSMSDSCALVVLAFDMTCSSVTDVDFPVDMLTLSAASKVTRLHRFAESDLHEALLWWRQRLTDSMHRFPMSWAQPLGIPEPTGGHIT